MKYPWRFECNIIYGEIDPIVTVFVGDAVPELDDNDDPTGNTVIIPSTKNAIKMKLSELTHASQLADAGAMTTAYDTQKAARLTKGTPPENANTLPKLS